jgi:photosystem II stability/assembly factor-like uncharacterized protein
MLLPAALRAQWTPVSPMGGEVRCLVLKGNYIVAATYGGGVLVSADAGLTWSAFNSGLDNLQVFSLVQDETYAYAGTGKGVFRLPFGGNHWEPARTGLPPNYEVMALVKKGNQLFAGTLGQGVYRSPDSGRTWSSANSGLGSIYISAFAVVGSSLFMGTQDGLYLTTDDGATWIDKTGSQSDRDVRALLAIPGRLFAGTFNGLYSSLDAGSTWTRADPFPGYGVMSLTGDGNDIYAGGNGTFARSADGGNSWSSIQFGYSVPWIPAMLASGPYVMAGTAGCGVLFSQDRGVTWKKLNTGLYPAPIYSLTVLGTDTLLGISSGTLFKTTTGGASWSESDSGMENMWLNRVQRHPDGRTLFAGSFPKVGDPMSGVFLSRDGGKSWTPSMTGLYGNDVDDFAFNSRGDVFAATNGYVSRSLDTGKTWTTAATGLTTNFITSIAADPDGRLFAGSLDQGLFRSLDNAATWTKIAPANSWIRRIVINARGQIFGISNSSQGGVYRSLDHGESWKLVLGGGNSSALALTLDAAGNLFAAAGYPSYSVWASADDGDHWTEIPTHFPVGSSILDLGSDGTHLFAATFLGVAKIPLTGILPPRPVP